MARQTAITLSIYWPEFIYYHFGYSIEKLYLNEHRQI